MAFYLLAGQFFFLKTGVKQEKKVEKHCAKVKISTAAPTILSALVKTALTGLGVPK